MFSRASFSTLCASVAICSTAVLSVPASLSAAVPPSAPVRGNAAVGEKFFIQCRACHTVQRGGPNTVGPNLSGVMGAKSGRIPGYKYSAAMEKAKLTWTPATMDAWLSRPSALAPGTKMAFPGMSNPKARADVIAYLQTLK